MAPWTEASSYCEAYLFLGELKFKLLLKSHLCAFLNQTLYKIHNPICFYMIFKVNDRASILIFTVFMPKLFSLLEAIIFKYQ